MRHRKKFNHLSRKSAHRRETLSSMATALILNKRINTTVAKAKALRVYVEPLITKSKVDSTHSRRVVFGYLENKNAVSELFRDVAQKIADRPGGYTRILKTGFRKGDAAEMCFIELVDYNTNMLKTDEETQQKRTRRSRRGKKSGEGEKPVAQKAAAKTETADKEAQPATESPKAPEAQAATETQTIPEQPTDETAVNDEKPSRSGVEPSESPVAEDTADTKDTKESTEKKEMKGEDVEESPKAEDPPRKDDKKPESDQETDSPSDEKK